MNAAYGHYGTKYGHLSGGGGGGADAWTGVIESGLNLTGQIVQAASQKPGGNMQSPQFPPPTNYQPPQPQPQVVYRDAPRAATAAGPGTAMMLAGVAGLGLLALLLK